MGDTAGYLIVELFISSNAINKIEAFGLDAVDDMQGQAGSDQIDIQG